MGISRGAPERWGLGRVSGVVWETSPAGVTCRLATDRRVGYAVHHVRHCCFAEDNGIVVSVLGECPVLAVVDGNIQRIYGYRMQEYFERHLNLRAWVTLDVSERMKTLGTVERLCATAQEVGLPRTGIFVGIGGGVLLDIVGFASSMFRRGVRFVKIPTTLVGLVDVGVGIKQGVNFGNSKNLVGAFYPPLATIADRTFLATLDARQIRCGVAEILKMALVRDGRLFRALEEHAGELVRSNFARPHEVADDVMTTAAADMMDELCPNLFEEDLRRLVDFGHSFSPTIEAHSEYRIAHGEAVALDMLLSCLLAVHRGKFTEEDLARVVATYESAGLPFWMSDCPSETELYEGLAEIRAHRGGRLNLVLPRRIGKGMFVADVTRAEVGRAVGVAREMTGAQARGAEVP
jgi:3-dehydroquinate synthase